MLCSLKSISSLIKCQTSLSININENGWIKNHHHSSHHGCKNTDLRVLLKRSAGCIAVFWWRWSQSHIITILRKIENKTQSLPFDPKSCYKEGSRGQQRGCKAPKWRIKELANRVWRLKNRAWGLARRIWSLLTRGQGVSEEGIKG